MNSFTNRLRAILFSSNTLDIHKASRHGTLPTVKSILSKAQSLINAKDKDGLTPLELAAKHGRVEVCRYLLDNGADLNAGSGFGPLNYAAWKGHFEVVELLINKGADVNARISHGMMTPLHNAVIGRNYEVVELLLTKGADANVKDVLGMTPLMDAERKGLTDIAYLLRERNR